MFKRSILIVIIFALVFMGCEPPQNYARQEERRTEQNQSKLLNAQPPASLDWSLERENINNRTNRWNDPNKVSYIYLIDFGKVMAFYTIKGKVSSVNTKLCDGCHKETPYVIAYKNDMLCKQCNNGRLRGNTFRVFT